MDMDQKKFMKDLELLGLRYGCKWPNILARVQYKMQLSFSGISDNFLRVIQG